jgi:deazaflavin-dependent oxidoreductase (nitroreductase family)
VEALTAPPRRTSLRTLEDNMVDAGDYNARIIEEFRTTGGHPGGEWEGTSLILIHHVGARSGTERVTPVGCFPLGDERFAVVASSGGTPSHPGWYHNLKASPVITVEVGSETFTAVAEELAGSDRAELWAKLVARYPTLAAHQAKTTRRFPVLVLTRRDRSGP